MTTCLTMSVLENLPALIDRPRRSRRAVATAPNRNITKKGIVAGAAGDLTIVRPAAAAPPRRPEQVEQVGRHRAAQPRARA